MKIRTITCHNVNNFGASLQATALCEYLRRLGHDAKVIDYIPERHGHIPHRSRLRTILEWPLFRPIARLIDNYREYRRRDRRRRFAGYLSTLPLTERYSSLNQLRDNPPQADLYIAGSDQIWNPRFANGRDPAFYLHFGPESVRRASYAASFASKRLPVDSFYNMKARLARLDDISVRESSGLDILTSLGYEGIQVVDPVFLLPRSYWDAVADRSEIVHKGNYILLYGFDAGSLIMSVARQLSKQLGIPVISISPYPVKGVKKNYCNAGPVEFLSLLRGASVVLTESFHALAFAMIFQVPFYAFRRQESLNARLTDFLSSLGLSRRLITSEATTIPPVEMDFSAPEAILDKMRDTSVDYLNRITSPAASTATAAAV